MKTFNNVNDYYMDIMKRRVKKFINGHKEFGDLYDRVAEKLTAEIGDNEWSYDDVENVVKISLEGKEKDYISHAIDWCWEAVKMRNLNEIIKNLIY